MAEHGLIIKPGNDVTRLELSCEHQHGLLYIAPGERSWVCEPTDRHAHALAGLFKELVALRDPRIQEAMQRWGVYFRELPLESAEAEATPPAKE